MRNMNSDRGLVSSGNSQVPCQANLTSCGNSQKQAGSLIASVPPFGTMSEHFPKIGKEPHTIFSTTTTRSGVRLKTYDRTLCFPVSHQATRTTQLQLSEAVVKNIREHRTPTTKTILFSLSNLGPILPVAISAREHSAQYPRANANSVCG